MEEIKASLTQLSNALHEFNLTDEEHLMIQDIISRLESDINELSNSSEAFDSTVYTDFFNLFTHISFVSRKTNLLQQVEPEAVRTVLLSECPSGVECPDGLINLLVKQLR